MKEQIHISYYLGSFLVLSITLVITGIGKLAHTGFDVRGSQVVIHWLILPGFCQQSRDIVNTNYKQDTDKEAWGPTTQGDA